MFGMATVGRLFTFAEFERLPDHVGKLELLRGEIFESPPRDRKIGTAKTRIFLRMHSAIGRAEVPELGQAYQGMGYCFRDDGWLVPKVSVSYSVQEADKRE